MNTVARKKEQSTVTMINAFDYSSTDTFQCVVPLLQETIRQRMQSCIVSFGEDIQETSIDIEIEEPTWMASLLTSDADDTGIVTPETTSLHPIALTQSQPRSQLEWTEEHILVRLHLRWQEYLSFQHTAQWRHQHALSTGWHMNWPSSFVPPHITIQWEGSGKTWCPALSSGKYRDDRQDRTHLHAANVLQGYHLRRAKLDTRWTKKMRRELSGNPCGDYFDDPQYQKEVRIIWMPCLVDLLSIWYRSRRFPSGQSMLPCLLSAGIGFRYAAEWGDTFAHCTKCDTPLPLIYTSAPGQPWKTTFVLCQEHVVSPLSPLQTPP